MARQRNSSERLTDYMTQLRRHLLTCHDCKGALNVGSARTMCQQGTMLVVSSAREFNSVIELRRKAFARGNPGIHACPDLSKHGQAYALTAPMFMVTAMQGELF